MSDEQHQAVIGRTVEEYVDSKKKLAALQVEISKIGTFLSKTGQGITSFSNSPAAGPGFPSLFQEAQNLQSRVAGLPVLMQDIKDEFERKESLYLRLKTMGFEPKD